MAKKKTFNVQAFKDDINRRLLMAYEAKSDSAIYDTQAFCAALCSILESVLAESGNYNGFNYLYWMKVGCDRWNKDGQPDFPKKNEYLYGGKEYCRHYY